MISREMQVEECCGWCRRPVDRCAAPSCDDTRTYTGILVRGEWKELEPVEEVPAPA